MSRATRSVVLVAVHRQLDRVPVGPWGGVGIAIAA